MNFDENDSNISEKNGIRDIKSDGNNKRYENYGIETRNSIRDRTTLEAYK